MVFVLIQQERVFKTNEISFRRIEKEVWKPKGTESILFLSHENYLLARMYPETR